jgi:hypothetical protein
MQDVSALDSLERALVAAEHALDEARRDLAREERLAIRAASRRLAWLAAAAVVLASVAPAGVSLTAQGPPSSMTVERSFTVVDDQNRPVVKFLAEGAQRGVFVMNPVTKQVGAEARADLGGGGTVQTRNAAGQPTGALYVGGAGDGRLLLNRSSNAGLATYVEIRKDGPRPGFLLFNTTQPILWLGIGGSGGVLHLANNQGLARVNMGVSANGAGFVRAEPVDGGAPPLFVIKGR